MSYAAFKLATKDKKLAAVDGFTPDQRFFIAFAQSWRTNERPEAVRLHVGSDVHSPVRWRVLGSVANFPEFLPGVRLPETGGELAADLVTYLLPAVKRDRPVGQTFLSAGRRAARLADRSVCPTGLADRNVCPTRENAQRDGANRGSAPSLVDAAVGNCGGRNRFSP